MDIAFRLGEKRFLIQTDINGFTLKEMYTSKDKSGEYQFRETVLGYYSSLGNAINKAIHAYMSDGEEVVTLHYYVGIYESSVKYIESILKSDPVDRMALDLNNLPLIT